ncbi:hypothetical protein ACQPXH_30345 [Nocardia sp. CA-135953]|uniref:hypothetical protein n=1 Tax=Nocardia sp. CA-135953 TaxID=3239978 RepID=UPI003D98CDC5
MRQFVNESGDVTRGLREGRYVLTINGEPLAEVTPIRRRRFVPGLDELVTVVAVTRPDGATG